MKIFKCSLL